MATGEEVVEVARLEDEGTLVVGEHLLRGGDDGPIAHARQAEG